jgi:hypothetical protein
VAVSDGGLLVHTAGERHMKPDFLSRHPTYNRGEQDNEDVTLLKEYHFREMSVKLGTMEEEDR